MSDKTPKPVVLIILDGYGLAEDAWDNAVTRSGSDRIAELMQDYPWVPLATSGESVGLPEGQMGNSEVGHMTMGTGRIIFQSLPLIDRAIRNGELENNPVIAKALQEGAVGGRRLHLMGLMSDGGVHSHMAHCQALVELAEKAGCKDIAIHAFLDGRDVPPRAAAGHMAKLQSFLEGRQARVVSVLGRYYGMDRDQRWERTEKAYAALVRGEGERFADPVAAIEASYGADVGDEFMVPVLIGEDDNLGTIRDGDVVLFFNFRADRARQITRALNEADFDGFSVGDRPALSYYACMTEYHKDFGLPVAFPPPDPKDIFADIISGAGLKQFRVAETEKYAHVTFFFNGGREQEYPGEDRQLVPSPKVATYDLQPEMSAAQVAEAILSRVEAGEHDVYVCNFANPDMVGHTGVLDAAKDACKTVDVHVHDICSAVAAKGGVTIVTADHGNAEDMVEEDGVTPMTAHTLNPVPCVMVGQNLKGLKLQGQGTLADLAPTMLGLLGLPQPEVMTGKDLLACLKVETS